MWVVKLGGSLWRGGWLAPWCHVLADLPGPLLVVPGGGFFADRVRAAQGRQGFSDLTAHRLALKAMDRMAALLCRLEPRLQPTRSLHGTEAPHRVWMPFADLSRDTSVTADWTVTSDSLAALAARRTGARGLVVVKSARLKGRTAEASRLAAAGVVDAAFPSLAADCGCPVWLVHRSQGRAMAGLARGGPEDGLRLCFPHTP
ncbi:MAG: aspartate/glutamate/uridylate kinase [Gammaproteobacteria bacterium]|nr:aspartate/glutamate/uridylate kinase [Gammaproteobacteria bacterium]